MAEENDSDLAEPLSFNLLGYPERLSFVSVEKIRSWAEEEVSFWNQYEKQLYKAGQLGKRAFGKHIQPLRSLESNAREWLSTTDNPVQRARVLALMLERVSEIDRGFSISSKSPQANRIVETVDSSPYLAASLLAQEIGIEFNLSGGDAFQIVWGLIDAKLDKIDAAAQINALQESVNDWQDHWKDLVADVKGDADRYSLDVDEKIRNYEKMRKAHEEEFMSMREAYSTEMKLRASTKYWGARRKIMEGRAADAFTRFLQTALGGGAILLLIYWLISSVAGINGDTFTTLNILAYGMPTILFIWIVRILYTSYLSSLDQAEDAGMRVAMVHTFKALEYEGKASEEERAIILSALFRPKNPAFIDEGVPNPVWEAIMKRVSGPN